MKRILPFLLLVPLLLSCGPNPTREELRRIADIVYEEPDSALSALSLIPQSSLTRDEDIMKHTLLYALALNRLHIDTLNVNVLLPVEGYFRRHRKEEELMKTLYCLGRLYSEQEDWTQAILCFKESERLATLHSDPYFEVILLSSMRYMFLKNYDNESVLEYARKTNEAVEVFHTNESWRREDIMALAEALADSGLYHESDSLFQIVFTQLDTAEVSSRELLYGARCAMNKRGMQPERAILYTERALSADAVLNEEQLYQYSYAMILSEKEPDVQPILDSLREQSPSLISDFWNYKITRHKNDYESALGYCESFAGRRINDLLDKSSRSIHKAVAKQEALSAELNRKQSLVFLRTTILATLLSMIAIITLVLFLRYRRLCFEQEIEKMESYARENDHLLSLTRNDYLSAQENNVALTEANNELNERIHCLQLSICHSFQEQLTDIGSIISTDLSRINEDSLKKKVVHNTANKIEKILDDIIKREKGQEAFENEINTLLDDVMTKIRSDFPNLSSKDYLFVGYMAAHFDTSTIAFLTNMNKGNVRTKMHRIRKLIFTLPSQNTELYRAIFQTRYFEV